MRYLLGHGRGSRPREYRTGRAPPPSLPGPYAQGSGDQAWNQRILPLPAGAGEAEVDGGSVPEGHGMRTPKEWAEWKYQRDWRKSPGDKIKLEDFVVMIQLDVLEELGNSPTARIDAREWFRRLTSVCRRLSRERPGRGCSDSPHSGRRAPSCHPQKGALDNLKKRH